MALFSFIPDLWEKVPLRIQQAIAIGIGVGLVLVMLMAMWLVWGSGYFQERLGIPITKQDLQEQTHTLQTDQSDLVEQTVQAAIEEYDTRLQQYLYDKEDHARRTILEPILSGMESLQRSQQQILRSQSSTSQQVQDMPALFDRKLDRLIEETKREEERKRERDLLEELLRRAQEREQDSEEPEHPHLKTTKKQF